MVIAVLLHVFARSTAIQCQLTHVQFQEEESLPLGHSCTRQVGKEEASREKERPVTFELMKDETSYKAGQLTSN